MNNDNLTLNGCLQQLSYDWNMAANQITDLYAIIKNALDIISQSDSKYQANRIAKLQKHFQCILGALTHGYKEGTLSEDEINALVNVCVCNYLLTWIENANNTRQTANSFPKQKYSLDDSKSSGYIDPSESTRIYRGIEVYRDNVTIDNMSQSGRTPENDLCNFIELCFADAYTNYKIELYRLLFLRKHPFETQANKQRNTSLIKQYDEYVKFMREIAQEKSNREFTVKSLLFYKMEQTFRFVFAAKIALYMKEKNIDVFTPIPEVLSCYYQRINRNGYVKGDSISPFISNYDTIISAAYNDPTSEDATGKILIARKIVDDALGIYYALYKQELKSDWTEMDFNNAADFLKNDYKMIDILSCCQFDESMKIKKRGIPTVYDYIKTIYLETGLIDLDRLNHARDSTRTSAHKRNKR